MGTVVRRIERRMGLRQIAGMGDYLSLLRKDPQELVQLAKDMLIGVSSFFRDPEAFGRLQETALAPLVAGRSFDSPFRVWVPGCATGEEAYSVTMLLMEALASAGKGNPVQVFASDVDEDALETARTGIYPESIAVDVPPERLDRFFSHKDGRYQVKKQVREAVVFARQNLIADPPFSKMDLITCRNVLIYLQPEAQRKVISIFSFALNVGGFLFLGKSEIPSDPRGLFEVLSKPHRIYRLVRQNDHAADLPVFSGACRGAGVADDCGPAPPSAAELIILNQQVLLRHFGAAIVLVEPKGKILHFYGPTEKYLGHPKGAASLNVFDMAAGAMATKLRRAIGQALSSSQPVTIRQAPTSRKGSAFANATVAPVPGRSGGERMLAIILEDAPAPAAAHPAAHPVAEDECAVSQLEAEIRALRTELEETNQEHESAGEQLKAANEEVMSMNEELQSTNEELETSKEELQSINEELNTVNNQLNEKVLEITEVNNDLANLFSSTEIATVFLDTQLRIKRFTPRAIELFNLIPSDLGRPLAHITQNFDGNSLSADIAAVMRDLTPIEKEVQTPENRWYTMRILPYRTLDNRIDGAAVTFADVTRLKRLESSLQSAKAYAENIVGTIRQPLLVLDSDLRVVSANPAFYQTFKVAPKATVGELLYELGDGQWDIAHLRKLLAEIIPARSEFKELQVGHEFPGIGFRIIRLNACLIESAERQTPMILLALEDVTEREQARQQIESLAAELDRRVRERTAELDRAVGELEQRARQLRALAAELTLAEHKERKRLAQILHDDLQQLLAAVKFSVGSLHCAGGDPIVKKRIDELDHLVDESIRLSRSLLVQLNPQALLDSGLAAAMRWLAEEMKRMHGLIVQVTAGNEIPADTEGVAILLFHAVRELLFNIVKHAGVKSATMDVRRLTDSQVQITVADEGAGFDPDAALLRKDSATGLGLFGIRERIAHLGGRMEMESAPGRGTRVTLVAELVSISAST
jgi:chemotaxis methyl-accepting protein methylase/signal transduction histidine kinase